MRDPYEFRVPAGAFAMRRIVAEAIGAARVEGVKSVTPDPKTHDVVYIVATKRARIQLQVMAARHRGVDHTGAVREYVHGKRDAAPLCKDCGTQHWPFQICEQTPQLEEYNT